MATSQTLIDNARTDLKIDPGKIVWTDAQLLRYLNEAVSFIYEKADFKFEWSDGSAITLVAGTAKYDYAADFNRLIWAKRIDGDATSTEDDESTLTIVTDTLGDFQQNRDMDKQGDIPSYIYEENGQFGIWPIPNATAAARWTIEYKYSDHPTALALTDTPSFPSEWHFIVEHYIRYRAWGILPGSQNKSESSIALQEWEKWSAKAVSDMLHRESERLTYRMPVLPTKPSR